MTPGARGCPGWWACQQPRQRAGCDLDWYTAGDEYVATDELGIPLHPEAYSDEFTRLLRRAGLPKIRLHDSRHTTLSLMEKAGVPISIVSKREGHLSRPRMWPLTCGYVARSEGLEPPTF
jgi:integrase